MLKIKNVEFFKSFANNKNLPKTNKIELAFVGRSNVGKSSLLNDLCQRNIAKTSATPGKTRLINYFLINNSFYFVDLPGYGYAKTPNNVKLKWQNLIETYLQSRDQLKVVFFLLDIRRTPNEHDKLLNNWFKQLHDIRLYYILTKCDKLSKSQRVKQKTKIALDLFADVNEFILYSTTKRIGKIEVLKSLDFLL